jgi:hypothetical protein
VRATMGGVLIAVTLLTSVLSNAQPTPDAPQPDGSTIYTTPDAQPTPQTPLPTATPAAPNAAPPPSPSQQAKTTSSKMANVQRLHARPGQNAFQGRGFRARRLDRRALEGRRTRALGSYLEREARECIRRNIPRLYESGGYGGDQAISFFKKRCFDQPGFGELAESRFGVLVIQEFSPEEWGREE